MKKQILFLAMFTMAMIFAGTNNVFGQNLTTSGFTPATAPIPLSCIGTAQEPFPGVSYTYEFAIPNNATKYTWWATKDTAFIIGKPTVSNQASDSLKVLNGELLAASVSYWDTTATASVDITWSANILARTNYQQGDIGYPGTEANPTSTFVVGYGTDDCTDNIKVWEINPKPAFTVDIKNIDDFTREPTAAYGDLVSQCVDEVRAAKYNATTFEVDYNFGWDTLYYEVVAANFVKGWVPTFFLDGLDAIQDAHIGWASSFSDAQTGTFIEDGDITTGTLAGTDTLKTALLDYSGGVSLYVRVVVANNEFETQPTASTYTLGVAGHDAVDWDITETAGVCAPAADAATAAADDEAERNVTPRPTLTEGEPTILPVGAVTTP